MNHGRPTTLAGLQIENDIAVLGLINRLREHHLTLAARCYQDRTLCDISSDLNMAAEVLMFILKDRDDMK